MKRIISFFLAVAALMTVCACSGKDEGSKVSSETDGDKVMIEMIIEDFGTVKLELYPEVAPITCANFEKLVKEGFYNGLIFHRVISGFMIQGGDPEGTGMGGAKENIKGEFAQNGIKNDLKHTRGVISMAR